MRAEVSKAKIGPILLGAVLVIVLAGCGADQAEPPMPAAPRSDVSEASAVTPIALVPADPVPEEDIPEPAVAPAVFPERLYQREAFTALFEAPGAAYTLAPLPVRDPYVPSKDPFLMVTPWSEYLRDHEVPATEKTGRMLVDEIRDAPDGNPIGWALIAANDVASTTPEGLSSELEEVLSGPSHESFSMYFWVQDRTVIWKKDFTHTFNRSWTDERVFGLSADGKWMRMTPLDEIPVWVRAQDFAGTQHYQFDDLTLAGAFARSGNMLPVNKTFTIRSGPGETHDIVAERTLDGWHPLRGLKRRGGQDGDWIEIAYSEVPESYLPTPCPISSLMGDGRLEAVAVEHIRGWVRYREADAALMVPHIATCR